MGWLLVLFPVYLVGIPLYLLYEQALEIPVIGEILGNFVENIPEIVAWLQATLETLDIFHTLIPKVSSTVGKRWKLVREMGGSNYGKREKTEKKQHKRV